ncbi:MAG: polysaccharide deacetylase family protein [Bacteroidota bacterium]
MIKSIYTGIRSILPTPGRIVLSKIVFSLGIKPKFVDAVHTHFQKGVVCISADFELAWAWQFSKLKVDPIEMGRRERNHFPIILKKMNELEIPITWATVGHLFLDSCKKENGRAHNQVPRPAYFENEIWEYIKGDWYDFDPCSDFKRNPEFYAPDLIEQILKSSVKHEIGSHSFSHCDFSNRNSTPELIAAELEECKKAMARFGIKPVSFVFPRNQFGNFNLLAQHGFKVIRYKTNDLKELGYPETLGNGLIALHDSVAFDVDETGWDFNFVNYKLRKYVDKAIEKKAICHFWFHPSIPKDQMEGFFFPILEYIASKRNRGELEILTMKQIGDRVG